MAALSIAVALVAWEKKIYSPYCHILCGFHAITGKNIENILSPNSKKMKFYNKKLDADRTLIDKYRISMFWTTAGGNAVLVLLYCGRHGVEQCIIHKFTQVE